MSSVFRRIAAFSVAAALVVAPGCGDSGGSDDGFLVVGSEMAFDAPSEVAPGSYSVTFRNDGALPHELAFKDPAGEFAVRRSIAAASEVTIEVELTEGTWQLECLEPGHMEAGMYRPLVVAE
jgi:uncharacterized cupredoxin-like copper-binding protein